jgi:TRAP-type C4-dicarboxylate transport system substrate-binding protein
MGNEEGILVSIALLLFILLIITGCSQSPATPTTTANPMPAQTTTDVSQVGETTVDLKFSYWVSPNDPWVQRGILDWGPELEKKTNGKVKVTYFGNATLGAPPDHLDLVINGTADIGWINHLLHRSISAFGYKSVTVYLFYYAISAKVFWKQQKFLMIWNSKIKSRFCGHSQLLSQSALARQSR